MMDNPYTYEDYLDILGPRPTAPEKPALADEMRTQNTTREVCGLCHRIHPIGFHVPGEIWEAAVHPRYRDTIHCLSCFIERADEKLLPWDEHIQFWPVSLRTHLNVDALADRVEALETAVREHECECGKHWIHDTDGVRLCGGCYLDRLEHAVKGCAALDTAQGE